MRLLIIVILLLTASPVIAQGNSTTPSAQLFESDIASKSATASAIESATPSGKEVTKDDLVSSGSAIIDEDTTQTALIYTGIMTLILFAFIAGKKSSELDKSDN